MTVIYRSSFLIYNKREDYKAFLSNKKRGYGWAGYFPKGGRGGCYSPSIELTYLIILNAGREVFFQ